MSNEIETETEIKDVLKDFLNESSLPIDLSKIADCSIDLEKATEDVIVFYKNHNDEKSVNLLEKRLEGSSAGLVVFINKPKRKVILPHVVVDENNFLDCQRKVLSILFPIKKTPKVLAITGTNGKTTTAFLLMQILNQNGYDACFVGTTGLFLNGKKIPHDFQTTSPGLIDFWKIIFRNKKIDYFCIEASSHALDQKRFFGFHFDEVAFTNITRDHLDYHKNFESYFLAKKKILDYLKPDGRCFVLDSEDEIFQKLSDKRCVKVKVPEIKRNHPFFNVDFNKKNLAIAEAISAKIVGPGFSCNYDELDPPNGRLEIISFGEDNFGVVDFAHTPDAVENVLSEIKKAFPNHSIKVVFGCGGNRDKKKREEMGEIVSALSNSFVITNDNPRDEDPESIVQDILPGVIQGVGYQVELDRKKAIESSVKSMEKREILLILGKGHEDYQLAKGVKTYFSDKEVLLNSIKSKNES